MWVDIMLVVLVVGFIRLVVVSGVGFHVERILEQIALNGAKVRYSARLFASTGGAATRSFFVVV